MSLSKHNLYDRRKERYKWCNKGRMSRLVCTWPHLSKVEKKVWETSVEQTTEQRCDENRNWTRNTSFKETLCFDLLIIFQIMLHKATCCPSGWKWKYDSVI